MAQYDVTYNCGHTGSLDLYGKQTERTRKLNWLETINCNPCKNKNQANDPIIMSLHTDGQTTDAEGNLLAQIAITGGTRPYDNIIKSYGFNWTDITEGALSLMSAYTLCQGWTTLVRFDLIMDDATESSKSIHELAAKLNTTLTIDIDSINGSLVYR